MSLPVCMPVFVCGCLCMFVCVRTDVCILVLVCVSFCVCVCSRPYLFFLSRGRHWHACVCRCFCVCVHKRRVTYSLLFSPSPVCVYIRASVCLSLSHTLCAVGASGGTEKQAKQQQRVHCVVCAWVTRGPWVPYGCAD
jgi:hypothetical protein